MSEGAGLGTGHTHTMAHTAQVDLGLNPFISQLRRPQPLPSLLAEKRARTGSTFGSWEG